MPQLVTMSAVMNCSFGTAPAALIVVAPQVIGEGPPAANIMDCVPIKNIPPFLLCKSLSNPTVATATTAALGVLTPMPCVPVTTPWKPGVPTMLLRGAPALHKDCTCNCAYGGIIKFATPATTRETVGG